MAKKNAKSTSESASKERKKMPVNHAVKAGIIAALSGVAIVEDKPVELVGKSKVKKVDFADIKVRRAYALKDKIEEWTSRDFATFIVESYAEKYKDFWEVSVVGIVRHMDRIKQCLFDQFGFCDNLLLRDYIRHFFAELSDGLRRKNHGSLYFNSFTDKEAIDDFVVRYDYASRHKGYVNDSKTDIQLLKVDRGSVTAEKMDKIRSLSLEKLMLTYGIVLSVNFMVLRGITVKDALRTVAASVVTLHRENKWDKVREVTEAYSPYPTTLPFVKVEKFCEAMSNKASANFSVNVTFSKEVKEYGFLRS